MRQHDDKGASVPLYLEIYHALQRGVSKQAVPRSEGRWLGGVRPGGVTRRDEHDEQQPGRDVNQRERSKPMDLHGTQSPLENASVQFRSPL